MHRRCEVLDGRAYGVWEVIPARLPVDLWKPAHPSRWRIGGTDRVIRAGVMHGTSGQPSARVTAERWTLPPKPGEPATCATFVVGTDGFAVQCVRLANVAFHAHSANGWSYGMEFCARAPGTFHPDDPGVIPTLVQLQKGASIIAWVHRRIGIPIDRSTILGHAEADPDTTHTLCPWGDGIDVSHLVSLALEIAS